MKIFYLIITVIILNSCLTIKDNNVLEPLWYSDTYSLLSENKHIIFKASANSYNVAEGTIFKDAEYLSDYLLPQKVKEFVNREGIYYLLYSIEKSHLQLVFEKRIDDFNTEIFNTVRNGDLTSNLIEKYSLYNDALELIKNITDIQNISQKESISLKYDIGIIRQDIEDKISFTRNEVVFNVKVIGDIDGILEAGIVNELHKLGYQTSRDGSVVLETVLVLKDVTLDNNYLNKFWSVSVNLQDFYGESNKSLTFKGRESQLTEESLKQLIANIVTDKILLDLKTILP